MSPAVAAAQRGVTGISFGSPVVPLVVVNMTGASAVRTAGSPATVRTM